MFLMSEVPLQSTRGGGVAPSRPTGPTGPESRRLAVAAFDRCNGQALALRRVGGRRAALSGARERIGGSKDPSIRSAMCEAPVPARGTF